MTGWPFPLRRYQDEPLRAILESVVNDRGLTFSVMLPRQSGKNEISVRAQGYLLSWTLAHGLERMGVKAAPIGQQANISARRLQDRLEQTGFGDLVQLQDGYIVRVGYSGVAFLSGEPTADTAGHTASLALELDEAQDLDKTVLGKTLLPMTASTNATVVYYGTPWDDFSALEEAKQHHLALERKDGIRRHFEASWERVADEDASGAYRAHVEEELARYGSEDHPLFATQYGMRTIAGAGRLFTTAERGTLRGVHGRLEGPRAGERYVAGLDVGGSDEVSASPQSENDATVLTIGRVGMAAGVGDEPRWRLEVVQVYAWEGAAQLELWGQVLQLLAQWDVDVVVVDASGLGEALAGHVLRALGKSRAVPWKFTVQSKSHLGYGLLTLVKGGRCQVFAGDSSPEYFDLMHQLERARVEYLPSRLMRFYVEESEGHDDKLISLALCVEAGAQGAEPRRARMRRTA